ncbi:uncharacterized protein LOC114523914 [Dendronephthya gigantea]|uniref:uncharacterized protein LOC114523914 n=1 Tax=Dendronephthya gigantea TaxID=151771 RepID=UPI00106C8A8A|nr:uncharacterized protein LOC114523914 [Dendronephthya gigantea]
MTVVGNESVQQENVRAFLVKLKCPVLNKKMTFQMNSLGLFRAVTDPYVAHPHKVEDVLFVLCHMLKTNELDISKVYEEDIRVFLRFVQDDYERSENLVRCKKMVKELPFHKALDGKFVTLLGRYSSYALVPPGVPTQQLNELQNQTECLFLSSDALRTLEKLYTDLGVKGGQNVTQFYVEYVFKHFKIFTKESQMEHLKYVKDNVFPSFPQGGSPDKIKFLKSMKETPCIPDKNDRLHFATEFFDPKNNLFMVMFAGDGEKFPPPPFNDLDWLNLLESIGLQVEVTPQLFIEFCGSVARNGAGSPEDQLTRLQSQWLVKCLFSEMVLRDGEFLSQVSQIKFVASGEVEDELSSIHEQYQRQHNKCPPFIELRNAVPWDFRYISWTTVPVLPDWAERNHMAELKNLGIACSGPAYTIVVDHLQNLVKSSCLESVDKDLLKKITESIYRFLFGALQCPSRNPDDGCSDICVNIGTKLKDSSCIFLPEDNTFVTAGQLVMKPPEKFPFKPFLFPAPTEFKELQHFFIRLGATEKLTPFQIAFFLQSIHEQVGEKLLSTDQVKKISHAMRMIFHLLHKRMSADGIVELYLPSQSHHLMKSCDMVCKVSPRFTEVIKNLRLPILLRFEDCGLTKPADSYIDALPKHLTPIKFDDVVREEVASECKSSTCSKARSGAICQFQEQFQNLLRSDEFQKD